MPTRHWHFDYGLGRPADAANDPWPGRVRLFGYLGAVEAAGGGTFYVAGSHRAARAVAGDMWAAQERLNSSAVVGRLKRDCDWFAELCSKREEDAGRPSRFMREGGTFRDIPLRVAEMTGEPGDLLIWHPNLLHAAPSSNQRQHPRLVLSTTVDAEGAVED